MSLGKRAPIDPPVAFCYHPLMSQPVKLSDALVLEARIAAEAQERSIAGQVEYWAKLGRSVSELLSGRVQQRLGANHAGKSLSEIIETVDKPEGHARLKAYLETRPFPHFEPHPTRKGLLIRIEEDGRRSIGRFKNRKFIEVAEAKPSRASARSTPGLERVPASSR
jgi:ParD-like antitoxin of type II bacterial toxin-antitoxin system